MILVLLPLVAFVITFFLFFKKSPGGFRSAFVWSSVVWTLAAVVMVEVLSLFHGLTRGGVATGWVLVILGVGAGLKLFPTAKHFSKKINLKFSILEWALLGSMMAVLLLTGIIALVAAPNNWDSMTYHLPRVMHWIQNQSVSPYPTHILRQLYQPPGSEFLILHFHILAGNDQFVNLVQWFAFWGSILTTSLIAAELGANRLGQILTGFLVAVIPMGILQATSTQNDLVAGFWLIVFVYFLIRLVKDPLYRSDRWGAGCSLGLALLTKGTIYIFAFPWLAGYFLYSLLKRRKFFLKDFGAIILCCFLINASQYSRNIQVFGTPLSSGSENYTNTGDFAAACISNPVRNLVLHFGTPNESFNNSLKKAASRFHTILSKDPQNTTWGDFDIPATSTNEDIAGNPVHMLVGLVIFILIFLSRKRDRQVKIYSLLAAVSFLLFCLIFKWQLFHSRLHLPLFILFAPILGIMVSKIRKEVMIWLVVFIFFLAALPSLLNNERRPLLAKKNIFNTGREEQYFSYRRFMLMPYVLTAKYVATRDWHEVGFVSGGDDWEYPMWVFLQKTMPDVHIQNVDVKNVSAKFVSQTKKPAAFISQLEGQPDAMAVDQVPYVKRQKIAFISVYENLRP